MNSKRVRCNNYKTCSSIHCKHKHKHFRGKDCLEECDEPGYGCRDDYGNGSIFVWVATEEHAKMFEDELNCGVDDGR